MDTRDGQKALAPWEVGDQVTRIRVRRVVEDRVPVPRSDGKRIRRWPGTRRASTRAAG